jgi:co-chaperonin GroES (HSP10)
MKLITQNGYFIATPIKAENGIYQCRIINAMSNYIRNGQRITLSGKTGQVVLVPMDKALTTKVDKKDMLICHDSDILAVLEE